MKYWPKRFMLAVIMTIQSTLFGIVALAMMTSNSVASDNSIILQSTTSTQNSGLYDYLLPLFTADSGIIVRVVAVGTGQAITNARRCDGDVLIVHSTDDEIAFVTAGYGVARHDLMYNDFVILGPASDPAGIAGLNTALEAFRKLGAGQNIFASRGDNSGTHKAEKRLWGQSGFAPISGADEWYRETGASMGATLNFAVQTDAYVFSDRATWLAFGNKNDHQILLEGDPMLFNQYGVITVSQSACPRTKTSAATIFTNWLLSPAGQRAIASYKNTGEQLFFPNAKPAN